LGKFSSAVVNPLCKGHLSAKESFITIIYVGTTITIIHGMDKKDLTYILAGFCIILVIAFVIKPLATGQPVNTGLSSTTPTLHVNTTPRVVYANITTVSTTVPTTTLTPTPALTWNGKSQSISFVNPQTYHLPANNTLPQTPAINTTSINNTRTVYATISGNYSGTTQIISIPFPYWELSYTITPPAGYNVPVASYAITPTLGSGVSASGIQGSFSTVSPQFSIQVMDATDPNRIVRTISPPGGIDFNLWEGIIPTTPPLPLVAPTNIYGHPIPTKYTTIEPTSTPSNTDPRPWLEKFYEGGRGYYFIINSQNVGQYTIRILVPTRYIGQY